MHVGEVLRVGLGATKLKKFSVSRDRGGTVGSKVARGLGSAKAPSRVQGRSPVEKFWQN